MAHPATLPTAGPRGQAGLPLWQIPSSRGRRFGIGGTSLSSPLVSAIVADRDSFQGHRSGNINQTLYPLYQFSPQLFFHDVTSAGHIATNNGLFPAVRGYDLATGIGTIRMTPLIIGF